MSEKSEQAAAAKAEQAAATKAEEEAPTKAELATETIKRYMWWSTGAGLIPIPLLDLVAVSGVQLKMLAAISKIYGVEFHENRGKALIASLGGFVVPHAMSFGALGCLLKAIPVVGVLAGSPAMAAFSAGSAWALGNVFIQHFESGGTFLDFDPERVRAYYRAQFEEGEKMAPTAGAGHKAHAV